MKTTIDTDQEAQDVLIDMIRQTEIAIEAENTLADHFRPAFEACWEQKEDGSLGKLLDQDTALRLQVEVLDREANVRRLTKELNTFRWCIGRLK